MTDEKLFQARIGPHVGRGHRWIVVTLFGFTVSIVTVHWFPTKLLWRD